jgi:L-threonylcarbamoyladenylate synthase
MRVLSVTPESRSAAVAEASRVLLAGGVVVLPTDTVYGLAAHPGRVAAVSRLYAIKGRPAGKPIALLAADREAVERLVAVLPPAGRRLAEALWPGALTLVVADGLRSEGVRVPAHPLVRELLAACGGLLRVTSANAAGDRPALSAAEALAGIGRQVDLVIDDGPAPGGVPSTVVRVTATGWEILRCGAIPPERLRRIVENPAAEPRLPPPPVPAP